MTESGFHKQLHSREVVDETDGKDNEQATFEEVYPRYEFSELVRLFLALVTWLQGIRLRRAVRIPWIRGKVPGGDPHPTA